MATMTVIRSIEAPIGEVFGAVADARRFAEAIGGVKRLDYLTESTSGKGMRFRQRRVVNGKEMTMDFEVTDLVPNERVRIFNEIHGTE